MTWTLHRWVWRLEAPLFIGMPPAGTLNRCHLYLNARAIHGAVSAELTRLNGNPNSKSSDYGKFGKEVGVNCRFTYLYPAEEDGSEFLVWLPKYEKAKGLVWLPVYTKKRGNLVKDKEKLDRDFRRHLLDSRPGTAIAPETDSASEGTLRETECISPWWRGLSDNRDKISSVYLLGYIFLKNNFLNGNSEKKNNGEADNKKIRLRDIKTLFVGGDTRYGLGKICRVEWDDLSGDLSIFGSLVNLDKDEPEIKSEIVWGHALEDGSSNQDMQGMKEIYGGWEIDKPYKDGLAWAPGSCQDKTMSWWSINAYGYWVSQAH